LTASAEELDEEVKYERGLVEKLTKDLDEANIRLTTLENKPAIIIENLFDAGDYTNRSSLENPEVLQQN
jgi:hypothetical protein